MNNEFIHSLAPEITERKSTTNWTKQKCSVETWGLLIEAARCAPSSWNHQPARYILVDNEENIKKLSLAFHRTNKWAADAAGLIIQVANPNDDDRVAGKDYYLYDCGLAMMSLIYQAQMMALSCRQMIGWDENQIMQMLNIPSSYRVVVITAFGYPSTSFVSKKSEELKRKLTGQHKRFSGKHISFWEEWNGEVSHAEI